MACSVSGKIKHEHSSNKPHPHRDRWDCSLTKSKPSIENVHWWRTTHNEPGYLKSSLQRWYKVFEHILIESPQRNENSILLKLHSIREAKSLFSVWMVYITLIKKKAKLVLIFNQNLYVSGKIGSANLELYIYTLYSQEWWLVLVISGSGMLKQGDCHEFKANLGYWVWGQPKLQSKTPLSLSLSPTLPLSYVCMHVYISLNVHLFLCTTDYFSFTIAWVRTFKFAYLVLRGETYNEHSLYSQRHCKQEILVA